MAIMLAVLTLKPVVIGDTCNYRGDGDKSGILRLLDLLLVVALAMANFKHIFIVFILLGLGDECAETLA